MTAVAEEAPVTTVPIPNTKGISVKIADLTRLLRNALPFTGDDPTIPILNSVRLTVEKGTLTVTATDRFKIVRQRYTLDDRKAKWAATLPVVAVRDLLALMKLAANGYTLTQRKALTVRLGLSNTGSHDEIAVEVGRYSSSLVCINGDYPTVDKLFPADGPKPAATHVHLNPKYLAVFGAIETGETRPVLRIVVTDEHKPVHFSIGENVDGLLMPMRTEL